MVASESQNGEKELNTAINKLQLQYDQFFDLNALKPQQEQVDFHKNETLCQQHNALRIAS